MAKRPISGITSQLLFNDYMSLTSTAELSRVNGSKRALKVPYWFIGRYGNDILTANNCISREAGNS